MTAGAGVRVICLLLLLVVNNATQTTLCVWNSVLEWAELNGEYILQNDTWNQRSYWKQSSTPQAEPTTFCPAETPYYLYIAREYSSPYRAYWVMTTSLILYTYNGQPYCKTQPTPEDPTQCNTDDWIESNTLSLTVTEGPCSLLICTLPSPTPSPTSSPTVRPTLSPTPSPTSNPTLFPTFHPNVLPTTLPTSNPTSFPTFHPNVLPTTSPTSNPTSFPTFHPNVLPTTLPTSNPTSFPTFHTNVLLITSPTIHPTLSPTALSTLNPTPFSARDNIESDTRNEKSNVVLYVVISSACVVIVLIIVIAILCFYLQRLKNQMESNTDDAVNVINNNMMIAAIVASGNVKQTSEAGVDVEEVTEGRIRCLECGVYLREQRFKVGEGFVCMTCRTFHNDSVDEDVDKMFENENSNATNNYRTTKGRTPGYITSGLQ